MDERKRHKPSLTFCTKMFYWQQQDCFPRRRHYLCRLTTSPNHVLQIIFFFSSFVRTVFNSFLLKESNFITYKKFVKKAKTDPRRRWVKRVHRWGLKRWKCWLYALERLIRYIANMTSHTETRTYRKYSGGICTVKICQKIYQLQVFKLPGKWGYSLKFC